MTSCPDARSVRVRCCRQYLELTSREHGQARTKRREAAGQQQSYGCAGGLPGAGEGTLESGWAAVTGCAAAGMPTAVAWRGVTAFDSRRDGLSRPF